MRIALAGNPNSGKTTLFNELTGELAQTGNWSGVTTDKKEHDLKAIYRHGQENIKIVDLPGAYSISPYTSEEAITRNFIKQEAPDVIINIVDTTNLSRGLFFTTQLLELNIPVVIALNKQDLLDKKGISINNKKLADTLKCRVVSISALNKSGLETLTKMTFKSAESKKQECFEPALATKISNKKEQDHLNKKRFEVVSNILKDCEVRDKKSEELTLSDKVDRIVVNKFLGLPIFFLVMWGVYWFSQSFLGGILSGYLNDTLFGEIVPNAVTPILESMEINPFLSSLLVDGIIGGVGAVIGFLPLIMVLFFCLSLLEDSGYMARVAVVMDRYFKKIGLSGKSIIPMVVGSACAIPGVMATRTIENKHERKIAAILTPFVPCGAKLPIIALFSVVFFPEQSWIGPSMYLLAIFVIICSGLILKNIFRLEYTQSLFIMELPEYKIPSLKNACKSMLDKGWAFIVKAGTIILLCNTAIWLLQTYDFGFNVVEDANLSMLAYVGGILSPLLVPLGIAGWQLGAAVLTGFIAKENVVGSLAVMYAVSDTMLEAGDSPLFAVFTPATALAFMVLNLFTPPCFAAIGAMNSEIGNKKWLAIGLTFQIVTGYTLAMIVAQVGMIMDGTVNRSFTTAIIILLIEALIYLKLVHRTKKQELELTLPT
ncbi:ferrous iron transporter B [Candidatus Epulonipiscioides gigas]|nr:ferrous iron transporter B [Epulopiscium sp. SCG-C07WGA-EpuloA2]